VFWWDRLERQVRVEGHVEKLPPTVSEKYFHRRPRESQLSAAVSRQSRPVKSRGDLEQRYAALERELGGKEVPLPGNWGGYLLRPEMFEFWQGRGRLHDRLVYDPGKRGWKLARLER
jgi:pyridoxamine 5'-phosphate oxidase